MTTDLEGIPLRVRDNTLNPPDHPKITMQLPMVKHPEARRSAPDLKNVRTASVPKQLCLALAHVHAVTTAETNTTTSGQCDQ